MKYGAALLGAKDTKELECVLIASVSLFLELTVITFFPPKKLRMACMFSLAPCKPCNHSLGLETLGQGSQ